jgi:mannosyl-glycoprotein endo-beta-N-acetylglucosaminidase
VWWNRVCGAGLTSRNEAFFSACDGLFVNYVWDLDKLAASAARAMSQSRAGRRWDVYMGIDCFGRNTYGGGGWQCNTALEAIRHAGLSAALFAPGW